jgi:hypothetical protein
MTCSSPAVWDPEVEHLTHKECPLDPRSSSRGGSVVTPTELMTEILLRKTLDWYRPKSPGCLVACSP